MEKAKVIEILQDMAAGKTGRGIRVTRRRQEALKAAVEIMLLDEEKLAAADRMVKMSVDELAASRSAEEVLAEAEAVRERSSRNVQTAYRLLDEVEANNRRCQGILDDANVTAEETKEYLKKAGQRLVIQLILLAVQVGVFIAMLKIL